MKLNTKAIILLSFLITLSVSFNLQKSTSSNNLLLSTNKKTSSSTERYTYKDDSADSLKKLWEDIFSTSTRTGCTDGESKKDASKETENKIEGKGMSKYLPVNRDDKYSKLGLGIGKSSYFFDYVDPVLLETLVSEYEAVFKTVKELKGEESYADPYDMITMMSDNPAKKLTLEDSLSKMIRLKEGFSKENWEASISAKQLTEAFKKFKWFVIPGVSDPARRLVDRFDFNGDGRLNKKEFTIANIDNNRKILGQNKCTNCYEKTIDDIIDPMYLYADCDNNGTVIAEEMWKSFQKLKREDDRFNIYNCVDKQNRHPRTNAVSDFILKSHTNNAGFVTKEEFRIGVLVGYWTRQVTEEEFTKVDTISQRELRWVNGRDVACGETEPEAKAK